MLFPDASSLRVLVVADDPALGLSLADDLADLDGLSSVGAALPDRMSATLRLREPTMLLVVGAPDLPPGPQPVVALVHDPDEADDARRLGARGILRAGAEPRRLGAALRAVASGLRVVDDGLDVRAPTPEPVHTVHPDAPPLTPREREVLELLADGLSNKEIAAELDVGERTAKFHVAGLLEKLEARTRTEAVVRAARLGLLLL